MGVRWLRCRIASNAIWFHSPLPAAVLIYLGNALEAMLGACLITCTLKRPVRLETLQDVLVFVLVGAGIAPTAGATVGSATLALFQNWRDASQISAACWVEACMLGVIFLSAAVLPLSGYTFRSSTDRG